MATTKQMEVFLVTRNGEVVPELTRKRERDAHMALGRWLVPTDVVLEGGVLVDIGRQASNGVNPFRVQRAVLSMDEDGGISSGA